MSFNFNNCSGVIGPDGVQNSTADATAKKVEWVREAAGDPFPGPGAGSDPRLW